MRKTKWEGFRFCEATTAVKFLAAASTFMAVPSKLLLAASKFKSEA